MPFVTSLGVGAHREEGVTPWWLSADMPTADLQPVSEADALSVPKTAAWPLD